MAQQPAHYDRPQDLPPPPATHHYHGQAPAAHYQQNSSHPHQQQQQQPPPQQHYPAQPPSSYVQGSHAAASSEAPHRPSQTPIQHSKTRSFSHHSRKSRKSSIKSVEDEHAISAEKARRLQTKADPTLAMSEAEPAVIAAMTESSLGSIRALQHKDAFGNPIADPDLSNPTRNRWERPLDTIRSFEAAIDGGYKRRSMMRSETASTAGFNRQSSSHLAGGQPRFRPDSYYGNRPLSFRPENTQFTLTPSQTGPMTSRSSVYDSRGYFDDQAGAYPAAPGPGRQRQSRMLSDAYHQGRDQQDVYRLAHKDRSYETVTSAEGSRNSEPVGYQTDPTSSDNSSIERRSPSKRAEAMKAQGQGLPPNQPPPPQSQGARGGNRPGQAPPPVPVHGQPQQGGQAAVPRKAPSVLRRLAPQEAMAEQKAGPPEKRKSWLSRRFSKSN